MDVRGRTAIVTGGGSGIGAALAKALAAAGARVLVADLDAAAAELVAAEISTGAALSAAGDVADERILRELIDLAERELGPVELFFANAGVAGGLGLDSSEREWQVALDVNLMSHIRAARLLVPKWLERGAGYFVATASAAGLLTQIGSAPYAVSKHAAVSFAEWLAVTYGDRGVRVSCLCPMGVRTAMLETGSGAGETSLRAVTTAGEILEPATVARETLAAVAEERFLVLPHPEVLDYFRHKGEDYDRWLRGMRRMQSRLDELDPQA